MKLRIILFSLIAALTYSFYAPTINAMEQETRGKTINELTKEEEKELFNNCKL